MERWRVSFQKEKSHIFKALAGTYFTFKLFVLYHKYFYTPKHNDVLGVVSIFYFQWMQPHFPQKAKAN